MQRALILSEMLAHTVKSPSFVSASSNFAGSSLQGATGHRLCTPNLRVSSGSCATCTSSYSASICGDDRFLTHSIAEPLSICGSSRRSVLTRAAASQPSNEDVPMVQVPDSQQKAVRKALKMPLCVVLFVRSQHVAVVTIMQDKMVLTQQAFKGSKSMLRL